MGESPPYKMKIKSLLSVNYSLCECPLLDSASMRAHHYLKAIIYAIHKGMTIVFRRGEENE
jgi:hypothetical protein